MSPDFCCASPSRLSSLAELGSVFQRGVEALDRILRSIGECELSARQLHIEAGPLGIEGDGLLDGRQSIVQLPVLDHSPAAQDIDLGVVAVQIDGLLLLCKALGLLPDLVEANAIEQERHRLLARAGWRLGITDALNQVLGDLVVRVLRLQHQQRLAEDRAGVVVLIPERVVVVVPGVDLLALSPVQVADGRVDARLAGGEIERLLERGGGLLQVAVAHLDDAQGLPEQGRVLSLGLELLHLRFEIALGLLRVPPLKNWISAWAARRWECSRWSFSALAS